MNNQLLKLGSAMTLALLLSACGKMQTLEVTQDRETQFSTSDEAELASAATLNRGLKQMLDAGTQATTSSRTETGSETEAQCSVELPTLEGALTDARALKLYGLSLPEFIQVIKRAEEAIAELPAIEGLPNPQELLEELQDHRHALTSNPNTQLSFQNGQTLLACLDQNLLKMPALPNLENLPLLEIPF